MSGGVVFLLAACLGAAAGLRTFVAPAAVCWGAHLGWLDLRDTGLAFLGSTLTTWLVSALSVAELIGDKLPFVPNRTGLLPLSGRILSGAFSGYAVCTATGQSRVVGALSGAAGAVGGTFGGFHARRSLVRSLRVPDLAIALAEDIVAIGGALLIVSHIQGL